MSKNTTHEEKMCEKVRIQSFNKTQKNGIEIDSQTDSEKNRKENQDKEDTDSIKKNDAVRANDCKVRKEM